MEKLISIIEKTLVPVANKLSQNKYLSAISGGCMSTLGIIMVGAVFTILTNISWQPYTDLLASTGLDQLFTGVQNVTTNLLAVYMAFAVGYRGATVFENKKYTLTSGFLSLFAYMLLVPLDTTTLADSGISFFNISYLGTKGVFVALLAGLIVSRLLALITEKNIVIKLPDSVPPAISDSFSAIIPYFFITLICWGIRTLAGLNIPELVGQMLLPVLGAADNIFVYTLQQFLSALLWICGLHGDNITGAVINVFTNQWIADNNTAYMAGTLVKDLPYVWTPNLCRLSQWVSSCWPILVYMFMSSKKLPHLKPLATICLPPAVFCIIEPIMFGLPVVMNGFLLVPFILTHTLTGALTYWLTSIGFVGKMYMNLPWATPSPVLGYLAAGGSIGGIVIVFINFAIGMVIFYPFWKSYEKAEVAKFNGETA